MAESSGTAEMAAVTVALPMKTIISSKVHYNALTNALWDR